MHVTQLSIHNTKNSNKHTTLRQNYFALLTDDDDDKTVVTSNCTLRDKSMDNIGAIQAKNQISIVFWLPNSENYIQDWDLRPGAAKTLVSK